MAERKLAWVVDGLTGMTEKQLKGVMALTGEDVVAAVRIAARLPRSNQVSATRQQLVLVEDRSCFAEVCSGLQHVGAFLLLGQCSRVSCLAAGRNIHVRRH